MLLTSEDWWAKREWTAEHYRLARELMRNIRVLPQDWNDDVIQEVAMRYQKAKNTGRGGDYRAWLHMVLLRKSIDMYRKDRHSRSKNRPTFVSLESLEAAMGAKAVGKQAQPQPEGAEHERHS